MCLDKMVGKKVFGESGQVSNIGPTSRKDTEMTYTSVDQIVWTEVGRFSQQ